MSEIDTAPPAAVPRAAPGPVVFIIAQLPPAVCGLGDYSMQLLAGLKLAPAPLLLVRNGIAATRALHPELRIEQLAASGRELVAQLERVGASRVVLEYVGYGFQSRCCPLWLLDGLRAWRQRNRGVRLLLMLMELWFVPAWWKPDFWLQRLHRRSLRALTAVADRVFVSTEGYAGWLRDVVPPERLKIVPVGSNVVPVAPPGSFPRRRGQWILFGRQGSRITALRRLAPDLAKLHAAGWLQHLQVVGSREQKAMDDEEDRLLRETGLGEKAQVLGRLPDPELSRLLLEAEIGVCGQVPGAWSKSTIFMAYASHGVNMLALDMQGMTEVPLCWITHPSEFEGAGPGFAETLAERSQKLAAWQQETAGWPQLAAIYREELAAEK